MSNWQYRNLAAAPLSFESHTGQCLSVENKDGNNLTCFTRANLVQEDTDGIWDRRTHCFTVTIVQNRTHGWAWIKADSWTVVEIAAIPIYFVERLLDNIGNFLAGGY